MIIKLPEIVKVCNKEHPVESAQIAFLFGNLHNANSSIPSLFYTKQNLDRRIVRQPLNNVIDRKFHCTQLIYELLVVWLIRPND